MNDLVSDMQIIIILAKMPNLEQKGFLGQEWESSVKLRCILAGAAGRLWTSQPCSMRITTPDPAQELEP